MAGEKRLRPGAKPRNKNKKQTTPELEANEEEKEVGEEKTEDTASTDTPAEQPQVKGGGYSTLCDTKFCTGCVWS